jgi:hypothetical protein
MALANLQILLPKKKAKAGGMTATPTYKPNQEVLTLPRYRDHLQDLFNTRAANDSRTLMSDLSRHDSDVSAAFFAYQSIAGSAGMVMKAYDLQGQLSPEGIKTAHQILERVTTVTDYTLGYSAKASLKQLNDDMRYWTLLRGSPGAELVLNKKFEPDSLRLIDLASIEWREKQAGVYKPIQKPAGSNLEINLDIPTFFTARFHQNPTDIYTYSPFVAAINTIAARQQVINELYRITQVVGYPRMDISVLEEVLLKSAPPLLRADHQKTREFIDQQIAQITSTYQNLSADQPLIHTDAVKVEMVNDSRPATSLPISNVIDILSEQNMAALKTMPAVIGKGAGNGQVASVEARLFALNCDALNKTLADIWSQALTLAARLAGFQGRIEFEFQPVELRPILELEPQFTMKQSRWEQALSRGYVSDEEFHINVFGRPKPDSAPELSGTGFMEPAQGASVDAEGVSPNGDPLGRGLAPPGGSKAARSKSVSKPNQAQTPSKEGAGK